MTKPAYVHIVDGDIARRAQIARELYRNQIHAELYESLDELSSQPPSKGALLISDDFGDHAIEATLSSVQQRHGYVPFAVFSTQPSPQRIVKAMSSGALDYLEWPCPVEALIASVHRVCDLGAIKARTERLKLDARALIQNLSPRELDVLRLVVRGHSNKEAAKVLGISPRTVEIHRANVMDGLNAGSVADAVRIGIYAGLDQQPDEMQ